MNFDLIRRQIASLRGYWPQTDQRLLDQILGNILALTEQLHDALGNKADKQPEELPLVQPPAREHACNMAGCILPRGHKNSCLIHLDTYNRLCGVLVAASRTSAGFAEPTDQMCNNPTPADSTCKCQCHKNHPYALFCDECFDLHPEIKDKTRHPFKFVATGPIDETPEMQEAMYSSWRDELLSNKTGKASERRDASEPYRPSS